MEVNGLLILYSPCFSVFNEYARMWLDIKCSGYVLDYIKEYSDVEILFFDTNVNFSCMLGFCFTWSRSWPLFFVPKWRELRFNLHRRLEKHVWTLYFVISNGILNNTIVVEVVPAKSNFSSSRIHGYWIEASLNVFQSF